MKSLPIVLAFFGTWWASAPGFASSIDRRAPLSVLSGRSFSVEFVSRTIFNDTGLGIKNIWDSPPVYCTMELARAFQLGSGVVNAGTEVQMDVVPVEASGRPDDFDGIYYSVQNSVSGTIRCNRFKADGSPVTVGEWEDALKSILKLKV